ncbi:MAG: T9SS type A sorting domain-containing protein [Bacteroidetes bacterium]|nr:MAG: T9SS type A sorting domain-containing protein [Bacteroidota bacterium]
MNGTTYLITANEGDAREYLYDNGGNEELAFIDETRVKDLKLDPTAFPYADLLQQNEQLGRLKASLVDGDTDNDGDYDEIYTYGTRSVTVWNAATGTVVWDSKNDFEQIIKQRSPLLFNSTNDENNFDDRSDDKGPEPEGVTVGMVNGKMYAFIGFERVGGIAMYDLSNPTNPTFAHYISTRDFLGNPENGTAGNLAPEGMVFIPASQSPNSTALLVVTYEVSGSVQIFELGTQEPNTSVEENAQTTGLSVYPNPSKDKVTFNLTNTDEAEVIIYNSIGTQVMKSTFNASLTISKDQLQATGVYFYEVINRGIRTTGKLVIMD